ncbi:MAG: V-type ATP synthase subunit F [Clostridia bacterium]|nr:V-type ATP synthase subunit F [Clostridia bacterium]
MAEKQYGVGAVGEREVIGAFRAIGMRSIPAETDVEVAQAVHRLVSDGVRVIFITEQAARRGAETFERYKNDPAVTLIPIPGSAGSDGLGMERVHLNVETAIGADILFDDQQ